MYEGHSEFTSEIESSIGSMCIPAALGVWVAISSIGVLFFPPAAFSFAPPPFWGCPPCNRSACPPVACDESLQYVDGCGCCAMCAKVEEERCGGEREVGGRCNSSGLYCAYRLGSIFGESRVGICENGEHFLHFVRHVGAARCGC